MFLIACCSNYQTVLHESADHVFVLELDKRVIAAAMLGIGKGCHYYTDRVAFNRAWVCSVPVVDQVRRISAGACFEDVLEASPLMGASENR
jgi:hypothetical protein